MTPAPYPPQAFFFIRLEELFDLRQDVFGNSFQIVYVFHFADLVRHRPPDLFAGRHG